MQLIRLSANKESFKTVHFRNRVGLNFIIAEQKQGKRDAGDTTNGVGKSLLISIVDFCLGAKSKRSFKEKLEGWAFTLEFFLEGKTHTVTRYTTHQQGIILDGKELKLKIFTQWLKERLFDIPGSASNLSFRSLIAFFLRSRRDSYVKATLPNRVNDFDALLNNAFLLGLRIDLALRKYELKEQKRNLNGLLTELRKQPDFADFARKKGKKDPDLRLRFLDDRIREIEAKIADFEVAENYYEKKVEADDLTTRLLDVANELVTIKRQLENIERSRKLSPDLKRASIEQAYGEAMTVFRVEALKTLEQLEAFYQQLAVSREQRLLQRQNALLKDEQDKLVEKSRLEQAINETMRYLAVHQSPDFFVTASNEMANLSAEAANIRSNQKLLQGYESQIQQINEQQIESNKEAGNYVDSIKADQDGVTNAIRNLFLELGRRLYPRVAIGITIENNVGDNQLRYDIKPTIESSASDGIKNMEILCYDLALLLKGAGHHVNFLMHDGRLIPGTDSNQLAPAFKILDEYIAPAGKQYIISLNSSDLEGIKAVLGAETYTRIVEENVILTLKDASPEDKLLGIQVDFNHEE